MPALKFFDLKARKPFTTDKFELQTIKGRRFAIAQAPSGARSFRIVGKKFVK